MNVTNDPSWRELHRTDDASEALSVCTTINAMEFEAKIWSAANDQPTRSESQTENGCEGGCEVDALANCPPPYYVLVPEDQFAELIEVLPDILDEQQTFDAQYVIDRQNRKRQEIWMMLALAAITVMLAAFGAVKML